MRFNRKTSSLTALLVLLVAAPVIFSQRGQIRSLVRQLPGVREAAGTKTVEQQIETYGPAARTRLKKAFALRATTYPPVRVAFVAIKSAKELHAYAGDESDGWKYISTYPILGASGVLGPKLKEGDYQVPEGIYSLTLEPNTPYHLALRLNYPNPFDWERAKEDGRTAPGSDILVHGSNCSIGCLAMGDPASEDLFVLANDASDKNIPLVIAPTDLRTESAPEIVNAPTWLPDLYQAIGQELKKYPLVSPRR